MIYPKLNQMIITNSKPTGFKSIVALIFTCALSTTVFSQITSFSPTSGPVGTTVTLNGFASATTVANNVVYFGATRATVLTASSTTLTVSVPAGASYEYISVTNLVSDITVYSAQPFSVTFSGNIWFGRTDRSTLNGSKAVVSKDMDADGKSDVLVVNNTSNNISAFKNSSSPGSISFPTRQEFPVGSGPVAIAAGDLDADGLPDVAVVNASASTVSVLRNTSPGNSINFAAKVDLVTGLSPSDVWIADIDLDGRPDIITTNSTSNTVSIFQNNSSPGIINFGTKYDLVGLSPNSVCVGDIDADTRPDIIVSNYAHNSISVFKNMSSSRFFNFSGRFDFATGGTPQSIAIGDLDLNGSPDIGVANFATGENSISILRNTSSSGSISFAPKFDFAVNARPYGIAFADADGDGAVELSVLKGDDDQISVYRNQSTPGNISFGSGIEFNTAAGPVDIRMADFDNDNKTDLLALNASTPSFSIFRQVITPPVINSVVPGNAPLGTSITLSGYGFNATPANNIVFFGATKATVTSATATTLSVTVPAGTTYDYVSVTNLITDLTGFSKLPFIQTITTGNIAFAPKQDMAVTSPNSLRIADIDVDGKPDMVVPNQGSSNVSVYRNNTTGSAISFPAKIDFPTGSVPQAVTSGDLDADGLPDLVVVNTGSTSISVLRNTTVSSPISFAAKVDYVTGSVPQAAVISDLDKDGKPDIAVCNFGSNTISVFRNLSVPGTISFAAKQDFPTGNAPISIAVGDLDTDGLPDLAVANNSSNSVSLFLNTSLYGAISFASKVDFPAGTAPQSLALGNLDSDIFPDVVVANSGSNNFSALKNSSSPGNLILSPKHDFVCGTSPYSINVADVDGDSQPDVAVTNSSSNTISVFKNVTAAGVINFNAKIDFNTGTGPRVARLADLDADGRTDFAVPNFSANTISIIQQLIPVTISSFSPSSGGTGNTITITGTNLTGATAVSFGGTAASTVTPVNATTATAVVGAGSSGPVSITTPNGSAVSANNFTFIPAPTITGFSPTSGATGAQITITGTNFTGATIVRFGGFNASFIIDNPGQITATVGTGGTGNVTVITPGGTANMVGFTYIPPPPPPTISSFSPTSAATGALVNIIGTNLSTVNAVSFGGVPAAQIFPVSNTELNAQVANGASGSVSVTTLGGTASRVGFIYIPPPQIISFTPASAATGGFVTITGNNLGGATAVSFGGVPAASYFSNSPTVIYAVVGPGASGSVSVTTAGGTHSLPGFTYNPLPKITSFTPETGGCISPTLVTITGVNFTGASNVKIGAIDVSFTIQSATSIEALIPIGTSGPLSVTTPSGTITTQQHFGYGSGNVPLAYVSNSTDATFSVINTLTNTVIATPFGPGTSNDAITISPDGSKLYIASPASNRVRIYNTETYALLSTITVNNPTAIALNPDGSRLFVSNTSGNQVISFNTTTLATVTTYAVNSAGHLLCSPDGIFFYVASRNTNTVNRININTSAVTSLPVGTTPNYLKLTPDGSRMYVANNGSNSVSVINMVNYSLYATFGVGTAPTAIAISNDGTRAYVTNYGSSTVSIINTATHSNVIAPLTVGTNPYGASISPDGNTLYVTSFTNNLVNTISTSTNTVTGTIPVGAGPKSLGNFIGKRVTPCLPFVSNFTPTVGCTGTLITITGLYFSNITSVKFGGSEATSFTVINPTTIEATVGEGVSGPVSVTSIWGTGTSSTNFTSTCPTITAINPVNQTCGNSSLEIIGTGFTGVTDVKIAGIPVVSFIVNSTTSISAQVTGTTTAGRVTVTTAIGTAQSLQTFTIGSATSSLAYITNNSGSLTVVNTETNSVVANIPTGTGTYALAFSPDANYAYVGSSGPTLKVIETAGNTLVKTLPLINQAHDIKVSPDGGKLYVSDNSIIYLLNLQDYSVISTINEQAVAMEFNYDGSRLYLLHSSGTIRVYNTATNTLIKNINIGVSANFMRLNPSGSLLYVVGSGGTIKVVNTFSNSVVNSIQGASGSLAICFTADGATGYISNTSGNTIQVLNAATGVITGSFPVSSQPRGLQVSADGTRLFVKLLNGNNMAVVDLGSTTVVANIPVAGGSTQLGDFIGQRLQVCAPMISGFSPGNAGCSLPVIITGDNFWRADSVKVGNLPAESFIVNSNTQITAYFPAGSSGVISIITRGGMAQSAGTFTSTCPSIALISPRIGCEGTPITITGANFTGVTAVKIGGKDVSSFTVNSSNSISAVAGIGFNGPISVTTAAGEAISDSVFLFGTATAPFAYVANSGSNSVSVINGSTNSVSATVSVGANPDIVVVSPDGSKAYVSHGGTISIIHTATNTVVGSINSGGAIDMAFTNDGVKLYILTGLNLRFYNTLTNTLSPSYAVSNAAGMAISPQGDKVYIACMNNRLKIFDVFSQSFIERGFIGNSPKEVAISPDGKRLFIANSTSNTVTVLDALTNNLVSTLSPGTTPKGIAISPDGTRVYVSNAGSANVRVIDAVNGTNLNTIAVGTTPAGLSVSADGTKLYVANEGSNNVTVVNTANNAVITTIPVGNIPRSFGNFTAMVPTPCAPIIVSFDPALACSSGTTVTIKGANFRGATSVTFNGVNAASFAVVSDTVITAVTGIANNSGIIKVFTPWGVDSSATPITMSNVPAFLPNPNPFQLCAGAPRQFQPNIAGSFTYVASNGQSGSNIIISAPGSYTVTATDQYGCSNSSTFNVTNYTNCDGYLEIESEPMINYFDTLTVKIKIKGGVNIFSTFAYLNFNTTHLKYVDHRPGNYLGSNVFVQDPVLVGGQIDFGMSHITGDPGTYGDGTIWEFRFVLADQIPNIAAFNAVRPEFFTTNLTLTNLSIYNALGVQPPSFAAISMLNKPVALRYYVPVWPGDLNFDKKVSVADILPIGYFYLATGPVRPNASIFWTPQPSALWGFDKTNKTRNAYRTFADGTPDGVINLADQTSIGFNLGSFHLRDTGVQHYEDPMVPFPENIPTLNINMPDEELTAAQLPRNEVVTVSLGSPSLPLNNVYGIAFDVFFNPAAVNTAAITTNYAGSIFGTLGTHFTRIEDRTALAQGRISIGITRYNTTAINATGGTVMTITLPILASAPQGMFKVTGIPVGCNDPVGNDLQVGPGADSLLINNGQPCTINNWQGTVSTAWENPANWSCGSVPTATSLVYINSGSPYHPVINSMATCKALFLNNTMTLTVNTGFKLDLTGP